MKYILSGNFLFEVTADDRYKAVEKGWDIINEQLPEIFDTEGCELWIEGEEEED